MTPGTVCIHIIPPELRSPEAGWLFLSPQERVRAVSIVFSKHASHWIACRAAMRRILGHLIHLPPGEVPIIVSELGKPALTEPFDFLHFSISHCEDLALLAVSVDGPVGVDLDPLGRAAELGGCESTFCHPEEIAALPANPDDRHRSLLELWTAKEALLKALGTGFTVAPETVRIHGNTASSQPTLPGMRDQIIHRLNHPALAGYCAAVSAPRSVTRIEMRPFEASTFDGSPVTTTPPTAHSDG